MYLLNDICSLCLVNSKTIRSIFSNDNDGTMVKNKVEYVLSEINNFKSEILKNICIDCLNDLNYVYKFKQKCLQNLISLNNYTEKIKVKNEELNSASTSSGVQNQMTIENHFIPESDEIINTQAQHSHPTENPILAEYIKGEPEDVQDNVTINDNSSLCIEFYLDKTENAEIKEEIEIIKEEQEYTDSNNKYDPLAFDDSEEKSKPSESTNHYSDDCNQEHAATKDADFNTTSTDDSETDGSVKQDTKEERWFKCNHCQKAFPSATRLQLHSRVHTGERPFKCTICPKSYTQSLYLRRHKRKHTDEKRFTCDVCKNTFHTNRELKSHNRSHSDIRPFACSVCNKSFKQNSNVIEHMRIHTGEKPFVCQICYYKCSQAGHFKRHMRIHTSQKPYTAICKYCQRGFIDSKKLLKHIRTHHNFTMVDT